MTYAMARKDLKDAGTEAYYSNIPGDLLDRSSNTIPNSAYPLRVVHQDDGGFIYLLLNDEIVVAQSIDFDYTKNTEWNQNKDGE